MRTHLTNSFTDISKNKCEIRKTRHTKIAPQTWAKEKHAPKQANCTIPTTKKMNHEQMHTKNDTNTCAPNESRIEMSARTGEQRNKRTNASNAPNTWRPENWKHCKAKVETQHQTQNFNIEHEQRKNPKRTGRSPWKSSKNNEQTTAHTNCGVKTEMKPREFRRGTMGEKEKMKMHEYQWTSMNMYENQQK